jgi:hypothetical protein
MENISRMMMAILLFGYVVSWPLRAYWRLARWSSSRKTTKQSTLPGLELELSLVAGLSLLGIGNLILAIQG